jgi:nicotinamidase-related amidase
MNKLFDVTRPLAIAAGNAALIVVDMQLFDAHRDWGEGLTAKKLGVEQHFEEYFEQIDAIVPRIQDLLALFRSKEMEVIHIRVSEVTEDSRDVGRVSGHAF